MVVDVSLVDVGTDDESVLALGEAPGQLHAQAVGFLRRDLARHKGLPQVVGNHIVRTAHPAGAGGIGLLIQQELRVGHAAVTLVAGDEPAVVGLFGIFYIVDDVADRLADRAALAGVQRYNAGGGHVGSASFPKNKRPAHHRPHRFLYISFLVHIKIEIFFKVIFQFIQFYPGREPNFILFRRQGSHGIPLVLHPFLQPRKLFFG